MNHLSDAEILAAIQRTTHPNAQRVVWMAEGRDFILLRGMEKVRPLPCVLHHTHQDGATTFRYGVVNDIVYLSQVAEDVKEQHTDEQ
jgi:hypothetical protein